MSNSKKTVKGEFSNMYGDGKNLNIGKNKTVNELLKNIPNSNLNVTNNSNTNTNANSKYVLERKESLKVPEIIQTSSMSPFRIIFIIIILIILLIIGLLFYYKNMVMDYFNKFFSKNDAKSDASINAANTAATHAALTSSKVENTSAKVDNASAKVDNASAKVDATSAKVESTSAKIDHLDKKVDELIKSNKECGTKSGVTTLNNKLNNIAPSKKTLNADAYCYIGYDNGQRECMEAYAGDVCMSGEIFPTLDICINPKLRS